MKTMMVQGKGSGLRTQGGAGRTAEMVGPIYLGADGQWRTEYQRNTISNVHDEATRYIAPGLLEVRTNNGLMVMSCNTQHGRELRPISSASVSYRCLPLIRHHTK